MTSEFYKFKGKLHLWKYLENQSNFPGVNLTADEDGCESVVELLTHFKSSTNKPTKTLTLNPTTQKIASVGTSKSKFKSFNALTLDFIKGEEHIWTVEEVSIDEIKISFSLFYLDKLEHAIKRVKVGEGDFPIADKKHKNILYFWWYLDN